MKKGKTLALSLLLAAMCTLGSAAPLQEDEQYLVGFYMGKGEMLLIAEHVEGHLALIYRYAQEDRDYTRANVFPLFKERYDTYTLREAGPATDAESTVKFERDKEGYGISLRIGQRLYTRRFQSGERKAKFRFKVENEWAKMRQAAQQATMPVSKGAEAELVDIKQLIPSVQLDLRYATDNNCFGAPLVTSTKAYLDKAAAQALAKVAERLSKSGYGLVVWEAYRPWSAFKLATLALPKGKEGLLPRAEKGYSHNTGRSIDVSLYNLADGQPVRMLCDYDDLTPSQYPTFVGGLVEQRKARNLLREAMLREGFSAGEDEWWHFTYEAKEQYRLLNVQM